MPVKGSDDDHNTKTIKNFYAGVLMNTDSKAASLALDDIDQSILGHLDDFVSVVDKNYIYRAVSKGYEKMFGKPAFEIIGCSVSELHGKDFFEEFLKPHLDQCLLGESVEFQFARPLPEGGIIHIQSKHSAYNGPLTDGPGVAIFARDITELVNANKELNKERQLLKSIINTLPDFIFAKDCNGVYQVSNRSFQQFLNKPSEEIIGKTDAELMSAESAKYIRGKDHQVTETGMPLRCDEWVTYEDGRRRLMEMHKLPLTTDPNTPIGILGIGSNVTFERQAEQNRQMASLFFEVTTNPCFVINNHCDILTSNEAAKSVFKITTEQQQSILDLLYCSSGMLNDLNAFLGENNSWNGEIYSHDNRTLLAAVHKVPGESVSSNQFVLIIQNPDEQQNLTLDLLSKAYEDPLTKLPNRRLFFSRLESAIVRAERQLKKLAILYIDLDNFKPINDNFGHNAGDTALVTIAKKLKSCFRKTDTLARLGGDEFAALVDINDWDEAQNIAKKIHSTLSKLTIIEQLPDYKISASIGISCFPDDAGTSEELINKADEAMYSVKREPKAQNFKPNGSQNLNK